MTNETVRMKSRAALSFFFNTGASSFRFTEPLSEKSPSGDLGVKMCILPVSSFPFFIPPLRGGCGWGSFLLLSLSCMPGIFMMQHPYLIDEPVYIVFISAVIMAANVPVLIYQYQQLGMSDFCQVLVPFRL